MMCGKVGVGGLSSERQGNSRKVDTCTRQAVKTGEKTGNKTRSPGLASRETAGLRAALGP